MRRTMPPRARTDERRRELVAAAARLFDTEGYTTSSVETIARGMGLSKATLYHYFPSKEAILAALNDEFIDLLIEQAVAREGLPAGEQLRAMMGDVLDLMETHRGHVRVFFEHHRELSPVKRDEIRDKRDRYAALVEGVVARGMADGEFRGGDPRLVALAVFGMCNWAYQWYRPDGDRSTREIADSSYDLVINGLRRDP